MKQVSTGVGGQTTLGPTYNEQFDAQNCACCSRVLVVTEPFSIVVSEMVQAR